METQPPTTRAAGLSKRRLWWRLFLYPVLFFVAVVITLMWLEESLIFFPSPYPEGDWEPWGLVLEDAHFQAADGTKLHGWYVPHDKPRAVVLFCHGNAGNITHRAGMLESMHDRVGASVMIFDYRGYGRSEGKPKEKGVLADARAARAWLAEREGIDEREIVVMGRSLGGAVAVDLAAADGARALVLEGTFTSIPDMAAHIYPWLPVRPLIRNRFDSLTKIRRYRGPLLQSHGDTDTIVPIASGRKLFDAANEPKEFVTLRGVDHNDWLPESYYDRLREFFDALP
ncbi:MAG TPA: alpha/beta hydrolase [Planctomycetaceae bacterium]|nr:alpha/beta hydrolase [Planctomycetaceae bacterium]